MIPAGPVAGKQLGVHDIGGWPSTPCILNGGGCQATVSGEISGFTKSDIFRRKVFIIITGGQQLSMWPSMVTPYFLLGLFRIPYRNASSGRYMAHVQTYCFSKEKASKRHLVDWEPIRSHMEEGIHMALWRSTHAA